MSEKATPAEPKEKPLPVFDKRPLSNADVWKVDSDREAMFIHRNGQPTLKVKAPKPVKNADGETELVFEKEAVDG